MKRHFWGLMVCLLVAGFSQEVRAADALDVVKKAIKANGGKANIEKYKAATLQGSGKVSSMGAMLEYTATWHFDYPKRMRVEINTDVMGQEFNIIHVYDGKQGWQKIANMKAMPLPEAQLKALKTQMQVELASTLVPLLDTKKYTVSNLGEVKVNGKNAIGLNVTNKSGLDANFYFDPKTFLLIKQEYQSVNETGKEVTQSVLLSGYKKTKGIPYPTKLQVLQDGKLYVTAEFTEVELKEKHDDSLFKKPE
ncbi:MAG: hypothetical protein Tsb009_01640 [Planctomycetaceae bacterium]